MKKLLAALVAGAFVMVQAPAVFAQDKVVAPKAADAAKADVKKVEKKAAAAKADVKKAEGKAADAKAEVKKVEPKKKKGGC